MQRPAASRTYAERNLRRLDRTLQLPEPLPVQRRADHPQLLDEPPCFRAHRAELVGHLGGADLYWTQLVLQAGLHFVQAPPEPRTQKERQQKREQQHQVKHHLGAGVTLSKCFCHHRAGEVRVHEDGVWEVSLESRCAAEVCSSKSMRPGSQTVASER